MMIASNNSCTKMINIYIILKNIEVDHRKTFNMIKISKLKARKIPRCAFSATKKNRERKRRSSNLVKKEEDSLSSTKNHQN